jgi:hypothetical protein
VTLEKKENRGGHPAEKNEAESNLSMGLNRGFTPVKEMTDRQVLYRLELLYESRKRHNRQYSMVTMAKEIEITRTTLYDAINKIKQFLDNKK